MFQWSGLGCCFHTLSVIDVSVERARVLFSYDAENEDELTIEEGQVIFILEKDLEDSGWWKGEVNGKVGVFPDNFVELLPPEEQSKPKKPPPPAVPPGGNKSARPLPPDPSKSQEPARPLPKTKEEPAKEEKVASKGGPPPTNTKRPTLPPPIGKKPNKQADPKLIAQTDDHKAHQKIEVNSLDLVEPTEKLNHPTASRVKAPQRRPPSLHNNNNRDSAQGSDDSIDEVANNIEPDSSHRDSRKASNRAKHNSGGKADVAPEETPSEPKKGHPPKLTRPPPPVLREAESPRSPASPVDHKEPPSRESNGSLKRGSEAEVPESRLADLQQELEQLRASTVSVEKYQSLQEEVTTLRDSLSQLKSSFNKKMLDLMNEVDEEKKTRLSMQVELARIKKLVTS